MPRDGVKIAVYPKSGLHGIASLGFLRSVSGDEVTLGHNNLKFDVPFLYQRLSAYGKLDRTLYNLLCNKKWLDLYQFLRDDYRSMDTWLKRIG